MRKHLSNIKAGGIIAITVALLSLAACDKKDNGAPAVIPGYGAYGQGCANCFANPTLAVQGMKSFTFGSIGIFTMDLLVGQSGYAINWQDPLMLGYYSGPAALQGYLDIQMPDFTFCNIAPGRYAITTTQAGMMYAKTLSGVRLDMAGPGGRIMATVTMAELTNQLDMTGPKIAMRLRLDSVNGFMCGDIQTSQFM